MKASEIIKKYFRLGGACLPETRLDFINDECLSKYQITLEIPSLKMLTNLFYKYNEDQIRQFLNNNLLEEGVKYVRYDHLVTINDSFSIKVDTVFNFDDNAFYVDMCKYKYGRCVGNSYRVIEVIDDNLKDLLILFSEIKSLNPISMMAFIKRYEKDLIEDEPQ